MRADVLLRAGATLQEIYSFHEPLSYPFHNLPFCKSLVLLALTLELHIPSFAAMHHYGRRGT
jgi:hypothetical protein